MHFSRRVRIPAGEMFPARETGYRVSFVQLASGIKVRAVERGERNAPPVLLLPGWGSTVFLWRHNMPALSESGFRTIAVDLKGMGLSDKPVGESQYTTDAMLSHLGEILDGLGLKGPVIIGHSVAASIAYRFARRQPGRVKAIVLISPVGHAGVKLLWLFRAMTPRFLRRAVPMLANRFFVTAALRRGYGRLRKFTREDVNEYCAPAQYREFAIAQRDLLHAFDWSEPVEGPVDVPVLLISGTEDHMVGPAKIEAYRAKVPQLRVKLIAGAGHIVPEEAPDEVNVAVIDFLRGLPSWTAAGL